MSLEVFLLYESSSGNQVDGLPLASVIRKLPELVGWSEGSATIGANDRENTRFDEHIRICARKFSKFI